MSDRIKKIKEMERKLTTGDKGTATRMMDDHLSTDLVDNRNLLEELVKKMKPLGLPDVTEVNMILSNGNVMHFSAPRVKLVQGSHTIVIVGDYQEIPLRRLMTDLVSKLGPYEGAAYCQASGVEKADIGTILVAGYCNSGGGDAEQYEAVLEAVEAIELKELQQKHKEEKEKKNNEKEDGEKNKKKEDKEKEDEDKQQEKKEQQQGNVPSN